MTASFIVPSSYVLDDKNHFIEPMTTGQLIYYYLYVSQPEMMPASNNIELAKQQTGFIRIRAGREPRGEFFAYHLVAEFDNESNALLARLSME